MTPAEFLKALMNRAGENPNSLSDKSKVKQSTIFRIVEGETKDPRKSTMDKIARVLCVPVEAFFSDQIMMREAVRLGLIEGKDQKQDSMAPAVDANVHPLVKQREPVPLISWIQAGAWCEVIDTFAPGDAEEWLPCPRAHGPRTYALRVRGVSMEPKYRSGAIIFVDPDKQADHGSNVVVRLEDEKEATFKQLVIEGDKRFLRPLNPNWPDQLIQINGNATICGVVIGQFILD